MGKTNVVLDDELVEECQKLTVIATLTIPRSIPKLFSILPIASVSTWPIRALRLFFGIADTEPHFA